MVKLQNRYDCLLKAQIEDELSKYNVFFGCGNIVEVPQFYFLFSDCTLYIIGMLTI